MVPIGPPVSLRPRQDQVEGCKIQSLTILDLFVKEVFSTFQGIAYLRVCLTIWSCWNGQPTKKAFCGSVHKKTLLTLTQKKEKDHLSVHSTSPPWFQFEKQFIILVAFFILLNMFLVYSRLSYFDIIFNKFFIKTQENQVFIWKFVLISSKTNFLKIGWKLAGKCLIYSMEPKHWKLKGTHSTKNWFKVDKKFVWYHCIQLFF